jgi:hypothetical protein
LDEHVGTEFPKLRYVLSSADYGALAYTQAAESRLRGWG